MKMLQYTVKRFVIMLFTLFIIATATFFLLAATPGDALSARVEKLPDSVAARMYAKYGLDKPVMERYVITMKGLVHGDFGESIIYEGQTVQSIIKEKGTISARLGIQQLLLGGVLAVLGTIPDLDVIQAVDDDDRRRHNKKDRRAEAEMPQRCAKTLVRVAAAQTVVDFFMVLGGFLHCVLLQKPKKRALPHAFPSFRFILPG